MKSSEIRATVDTFSISARKLRVALPLIFGVLSFSVFAITLALPNREVLVKLRAIIILVANVSIAACEAANISDPHLVQAVASAKVPVSGEGCGVVFWKQPKHHDEWPQLYPPATHFNSAFVDAFPGKTLLEVLKTGGVGLNALGREAVAAFLNSVTNSATYGMTPTQVTTAFKDALANSDFQFADQLEAQNERNCPVTPLPVIGVSQMIVMDTIWPELPILGSSSVDVQIFNKGGGTLSGLSVDTSVVLNTCLFLSQPLTISLNATTAPATLTIAASAERWCALGGTYRTQITISSSVLGVPPVTIDYTMIARRTTRQSALTLPAKDITSTSAVIVGETDGDWYQTHFRFGTDPVQAGPPIGAFHLVFGKQTWELRVEKLLPNTTYYFEIIAERPFADDPFRAFGGIMSFRTPN